MLKAKIFMLYIKLLIKKRKKKLLIRDTRTEKIGVTEGLPAPVGGNEQKN